MRGLTGFRGVVRGDTMRLCAVSRRCAWLCLAIVFTASVRAQTQATALPLLLPSATVFDAQGNLYFAETGNHVVRKLSSAGTISTVAGNGVQGFSGDGGPAVAAELDSPAGLALDAAGDLYIADSHNQRIREVSAATGAITTIAGTGAAGFSGDGGAATAAQLDLPSALALDPAGNLYVADTANHRVRRIASASGLIATVAGNGIEGFAGDGGAATTAQIDSPSGLALDAAGNLYLSDTHNGRVREVSAASGAISTVAGVGVAPGGVQSFAGDGGAATAAGLALPRGLTIDAAGNLYFADSANHRIRRISPSGIITTVAGQGTESFTGDNGSAAAASLDSPRSVAISPDGLLTLADSGNQRVRQLNAQPAPGPEIYTIAGLGASTSSTTLTLSGPSVVAYGNGSVTATLATATDATGSITFLDASGGTQTTLGATSLNSDAASFSTAALSAGAHSLIATYAGDVSHPAAQSSALAVTVTPLAITAAANPVSIFYGQAIPPLSGTLSGVLAQDAGKVAAVFTTSASILSPVAAYPIAASLTGSAAGDYTVSVAPVAGLSITPAPTLTSLSLSTSSPALGLPVTLTAQTTSTTSGVPTGRVTLLDGGSTLSVVPLSASGAASFTTSTLALGAHTLSATYSGDANFLPSSTATADVAVGAASDFTLSATGTTTQTVAAGSAATYNFSVAMLGAAISSPITLAVQGVPTGATASLNPSYIPPGGAISSFTLTVQTPLPVALGRPSRPIRSGAASSGALLSFALLLLPAFALTGRRRAIVGLGFYTVASCILLATLATGCGNRVSTSSEFANATTYTLTVTATATGPTGAALQHSTNVTLQIIQ
jgi:sugar lactone lactonase YvrE